MPPPAAGAYGIVAQLVEHGTKVVPMDAGSSPANAKLSHLLAVLKSSYYRCVLLYVTPSKYKRLTPRKDWGMRRLAVA